MCRVRERLRVSDPFVHAYACTGSLRCAEWAALLRHMVECDQEQRRSAEVLSEELQPALDATDQAAAE